MASGGGTDYARGEAVSFAHALDTLKQHGSALLVVGAVPDETYVQSSMQMMGDPSAETPRRRLLVVPEFESRNVESRVESQGPLTPEWARIVVHNATARSAAAQNAPGNVARTFPTQVTEGGIDTLGSTISTVIDEFDRAANGLDPAELRMAFDCLSSLLTEYDTETVFRFLHALNHHVREVHGMAHFWLPRERESDVARTLAPLFDAVIELRIEGDDVVQQWDFRDIDLVSDWLPLLG